MRSPKWIFVNGCENAAACEALARDLAVRPFVAQLLWRLGVTTAGEADLFLQPKLKTLSDPFLLPDMERAVTRLLAACDRQEKILLYGDYDVDGVTSLTLLDEILRAYGAAPHSFVPARLDEGYGLSMEGIERCLQEDRPGLLVAVDCGTGSTAEIAALRGLGIDAIVLDHHECKEGLPECCAVVNPKRGNDFHGLCSVGIVFKVCHALLKTRPLPSFDLRDHLDLVAVGTVADLVPLTGENRILVQNGIRRLETTPRIGLRALMEAAGVTPPVRPTDIGFRIGPRLNASGRLGSALESLELLRTCDPARAAGLAACLETQNRERQEVERATFAEAEKMIETGFDPTHDAAIVVGARGWHQGVIGIVASRLMRAHHRPSIAIAFGEDGWGKGSGRSIDGLSLVESLGECAIHLDQFGGHEMAAGLTLRETDFAAFRTAFLQVAKRHLKEEHLRPRLTVDAEVSLDAVDLDLLEEHDLLQPFGMGNPQPVFCARGVTPHAEPRVLKERHLLFEFREGRQRIPAIYFGGAKDELPRPPWDLAYQIERNEFRGRVSAQVQVRALRAAC